MTTPTFFSIGGEYSCAQRLIDANDKVLSSLTEGRKEQEHLREALEAVKANDDIVTALSNIQQICSTSSTPCRSPEGRNKYVNREVSVCLVRVAIVFSMYRTCTFSLSMTECVFFQLQVRGIYRDLKSQDDFDGWILDKGYIWSDLSHKETCI